MGMLRDRMEGDLRLKGFSPNTRRCYLSCARHFAEHYGRSPAQMGEREIKQYLLHLVKEKQASPATHRMYVASLKFLYIVTLRRPGEVARVPYRAADSAQRRRGGGEAGGTMSGRRLLLLLTGVLARR